MTEKTQLFQFAGERPAEKTEAEKKKKWYQDRPVAAELFLGLLVLGCLFCGQIMTKDPSYMDLKNCSVMPCREFLFGTMGRDIFSMIWYGGRISLAIGLLSTLISTVIAVLFGAVSGCAPAWLDALLMRLTEIFLSVPNLLLVIFLLAAAGKSNVITISAVIGMTSWTSIAKVASRCMGGSFFYILWHHLAPNFFSSIMFMVVMNIRSAIVAESTLSFMGIGLPLEVISWGSMLSLSEKALMTKAWWIILIPGVFLIVTLLSFTSIGNYLRKQANRKQRNL